MIDQILKRAETADLVLIFVIWIIYKLDLRSKNARRIDLYAVVSVTCIGMALIVLRAIILIKG